MLRYLALALSTLGLVAVAPGVSTTVQMAQATGPPDPAAVAAVRVLAGPHPPDDPVAALPPDFAAVMGYTPSTATLADGTLRAIKPTGACSAPGGGHRFGFGPACMAHDLGYDLLRYAAATGGSLHPDARRSLDAMLAHDLHASCRTPGVDGWACHALAAVYVTVAQLNSMRQGYGPPVPEPYLPWAVGLAALGLLAAPGVSLATRRAGSGPTRQRPHQAGPTKPAAPA